MQIPPAPVGTPFGSYVWADWYYKITYLLNNSKFDHNSLDNLQGGTTGQYYHLTSAQATQVAALNLTSGTYNPTVANTSNLDSTPTATSLLYQRVGDIVNVSGKCVVDPTAAGTRFQFTITLPVASTLTSGLYGNFGSNTVNQAGAIYKHASSATAFFDAPAASTVSYEIYFNFMYRIT